MALELEGKIVNKLPVQQGQSARGPWQKQEFILEYMDGSFPAQVCMNVWGADKVAELGTYQAGDMVKVSLKLSSREYNGRWYNDVRAWKMERPGVAAQAPSRPAASYGAPTPPPPTVEDYSGASYMEEDLPF